MATRFYFSTTRPPAITPTPNAGWELTAGHLQGCLNPDPTSRLLSALQVAVTKTSAATWIDILTGQFISSPLPAGTLNGTFSIVVACGENPATTDAFLQTIIRVVSNDGTVVRGVAYAGQVLTAVSSTNTAPNYEWTVANRTRYLKDVALSSVTIQEGDRIVVEVGARAGSAATGDIIAMYFNDDELLADYKLLPDQDLNVINRTLRRTWIEFSVNVFGSLASEEYRYLEEGKKLNASPVLPFVDVLSIDGLDNAPMQFSSSDREGIHGGFVESEFETVRTVTLEGNIYASNVALETYLDSLKANFLPTRRDHPLYFGTDAGTRCVFGKAQGLRYKKEQQRRLGIVPFQVQIVCQDPRIYSPDVAIISHAIAATTTYNIAGNRDTPAKILFIGPITNASITIQNAQGSWQLTYSAAVASDAYVEIDLDARSTILVPVSAAVSNVRSSCTVVGTWNLLSPGNNKVTLTASAGTGRAEIHYRPAWR